MTAMATARIGARVTPELHQMLKRAADIQGRTLTDFLVTAAHEAALRVIKEKDIISLSLRDQKIIADSLLSPREISPGLRKATNIYGNLIKAE